MRQPQHATAVANVVLKEPVRREHRFAATRGDDHHPGLTTGVDVMSRHPIPRCKLMLSNSDVPRIHELYEGFRIDLVAAPRAINCDATQRGLVTEVVVRNYADAQGG